MSAMHSSRFWLCLFGINTSLLSFAFFMVADGSSNNCYAEHSFSFSKHRWSCPHTSILSFILWVYLLFPARHNLSSNSIASLIWTSGLMFVLSYIKRILLYPSPSHWSTLCILLSHTGTISSSVIKHLPYTKYKPNRNIKAKYPR